MDERDFIGMQEARDGLDEFLNGMGKVPTVDEILKQELDWDSDEPEEEESLQQYNNQAKLNHWEGNY